MGIFGKSRGKKNGGTIVVHAPLSEEDADLAATVAIGAILTGITALKDLVEIVSRAVPHADALSCNMAIRVATECLRGKGVPAQIAMPDEAKVVAEHESSEVLRLTQEIVTAMTEREAAGAEMGLMLYAVLKERLREGRYYNRVEALMSPLDAAAIVFRLGAALQEDKDPALAPFQYESLLGTTRAGAFAAMKIAYLHRRGDAQYREHLNNGYILLTYFVEDELLDDVKQQAGEADAFGSEKYGQLLNQMNRDMESMMADWHAYTAEVDRKLSEVEGGAELEAAV